MNKQQEIKMLLVGNSSVDELKRDLSTTIKKVEYWIQQGDNVESNQRYLNEFAYPLQKQLDHVENLWQLSVIINLPKFK